MSSIPERLIARAHRLLASSEALIQLGDRESAVSRAYYAMFHAARAALLTRQLTPKSHKGVLTLFSDQFVRTGEFPQENFRAFRDAFGDRTLADYADDISFTDQDALRTLAAARSFVDLAEILLNT